MNKERILYFIQIILVTITVIFAGFSAYCAMQSAEYSERTVKWYESPKPLLCLETPAYCSLAEKRNYSVAYNSNYSFDRGVLNDVYTYNNLSLSFYNAGRIPAGTAFLEVSIFTNGKPAGPFPFKIFKITTPSDGFYYNESEESFVSLRTKKPFYYGHWYNEQNVLDFPPLIGLDGKIHQPSLSFRLGTIYPQQEVNATILLFATKQNVSAILHISVSFYGKSIEETATKYWEIPLSS